jgi:hypothetical protein
VLCGSFSRLGARDGDTVVTLGMGQMMGAMFKLKKLSMSSVAPVQIVDNCVGVGLQQLDDIDLALFIAV